MRYNITTNKAPEMPTSFRCFSPHLAHISAMQNFSILIAVGRKCAAKWLIWWAIRGVTRVN